MKFGACECDIQPKLFRSKYKIILVYYQNCSNVKLVYDNILQFINKNFEIVALDIGTIVRENMTGV